MGSKMGMAAAQGAKKAAQGARQAQKGQNKLGELSVQNVLMMILSAIVSLLGLPLLLLAFLFLIVIILMVALGGSTEIPNPSASGGAWGTALVGGDGKGDLLESRVPNHDFVKPLNDAAKQCDILSPVILAAQIDVESDWDPNKQGPDGKLGLSQLTPDQFKQYGRDDDNKNGASATDPTDSIYAQARYLCDLAGQVETMLTQNQVTGDKLSLTLMAYHEGIDAVRGKGGIVIVSPSDYVMQVRMRFASYKVMDPDTMGSPAASAAGDGQKGAQNAGTVLTEAQFDQMFPNRNSFYTYSGLTAAMGKYAAFATTGDATVQKREMAAFLANVSHESGGLQYVEELDQSAWGNYCDPAQPYGCPAGKTAYHGRGPLQISWNTNYNAAGVALDVDLLNNPDKVKTDAAVSWGTALWFWMSQSGAGAMPAHTAITGDHGFGETIRSINGSIECNGGNAAQVQDRVDTYKNFTGILGVEPGDNLSC
ncbi:glycoside hydrolase family 19 protein [Dactylosporangium sp. CA-092794]|uniref:glycoside hydrolase family 19 protein n=1 Tax=Dactylosporangium sp. CA-092794 TaxID=3239929 RepID=UPI003D8D94D8